MEKCEFSETQFVFGYLRELFPRLYSHPYYFLISAPSTRDERQFASDLIIKHFRIGYRYSEFYQFKRSKFYNKEVFSDLKGKTIIDTSVANKHGFEIYNTKQTRQFNTLQKLATKPRKKVYYCAPLFHSFAEFNRYFRTASIENNSKVIDIAQPALRNVRIPLDTHHKILFDRTLSYICSDPLEIEGLVVSERNKNDLNQAAESLSLSSEIKELYNFILNESRDSNEINKVEIDMNFFDVRDTLLSLFDIHWIPFLIDNND